VREVVGSRDEALDAARGVGIVLVIVGHALEAQFLARPDGVFFDPSFRIWQAIYAFHMPLFFLLSGAANRHISTRSTSEVARGSLRLVLFAWACQAAGVALGVILGRVPTEPAAMVSALLQPIVVGHDWTIGVLWFLVSLAIVRLLVHGLTRRGALPKGLALLGLAASAWAIVDPRIENVQMVKTWLPGALFFALGGAIARHHRWLPPPAAGLAMVAAAVALAPLNGGCRWSVLDSCGWSDLAGHAVVWMVGGIYGNLPLALTTAVLGSVGIWSIAGRLGSSLMAGLGRRSLDLFVLNGFVLTFVGPILIGTPLVVPFGAAVHLLWVIAAVPLHDGAARLLSGIFGMLSAGSHRLADRLIPEKA
jgi:fucose 4-O-acetylase-like acetyltransferase